MSVCELCELVCKDEDELVSHQVDSCPHVVHVDEQIPPDDPILSENDQSSPKVAECSMTTDKSSLNESTQSTQPEIQNEEVISESVAIPEEISDSVKVLSSFCVDAPTVEVRDCIRQYSTSKTYKQQTSTFNTYSKNVLTDTLEFLGVEKKNGIN